MRLVPSFKVPALPNIAALMPSFGKASQHTTLLGGLDISLTEQAQNTSLFSAYSAAKDSLKALKGQEGVTPEMKSAAMNELTDSAGTVMEARKLVRLTGDDAFASLHGQLPKQEKVHLADESEIVEQRLGSAAQNADCQAFILPTEEGPKLLAQIYRYHLHVPVEENGRVKVENLPGNISGILDADIQDLDGSENVTGYYSISSSLRGAGEMLVVNLDHVTPKGRLETTISPIREFFKSHDKAEILAMSDDEIRGSVLEYLMQEKTKQSPGDGVRNFHVGNGAYPAWIHIDRDNEKDPLIVNYFYDRGNLARNSAFFESGILPMSPELFEIAGNSEKAFAVPEPISVPQSVGAQMTSAISTLSSKVTSWLPSREAA